MKCLYASGIIKYLLSCIGWNVNIKYKCMTERWCAHCLSDLYPSKLLQLCNKQLMAWVVLCDRKTIICPSEQINLEYDLSSSFGCNKNLFVFMLMYMSIFSWLPATELNAYFFIFPWNFMYSTMLWYIYWIYELQTCISNFKSFLVLQYAKWLWFQACILFFSKNSLFFSMFPTPPRLKKCLYR